MPDVMHESARQGYDDAYEVANEWGERVGVATLAVDETWHRVPTGLREEAPIRVYILDTEGEIAGEAGAALLIYLSLDDAREYRDALDAAILQIELTRDRARRSPSPRRPL